ncbi:type IX secretion system PorP/SprF family membrane protein [Hymenobacter luteus]|uniref:Type IX secretion system PorP/SprF family membrane protein n=2 Tax=Hymenobacter TaxID=89966 RepID=A0A7W9WAS1_9BACT|nr:MULTISPECIES: PorP/SprF family type IX secretion system membrane protein [Hymenobacter]MBB4599453.1 type IX secretion system PorP/SprF family membrane protein [Hymenobacter latericoloratus]MBB6058238.1 type IX secretion system PorP/SprF family membrane protein [Hymenobacter luteus]
MPLLRPPYPSIIQCRRGLLAASLVVGAGGLGQAQDLYFAQPYANRLQLNPAYAGLLDDYSLTLSYRNQFPTLAGTFQSSQLAADYRLPNQRSAVGLLVNYDRTGGIGYTRLQAGGVYAYHLRLNEQLSLSGGASVSYGLQRVSYGNLVFGDQLSDEGVTRDFSLEVADYKPVHYVTAGVGGLLYTERFWLGAAAHHLNQPDLAFVSQATLPLRLNLQAGYRHYVVRSTTKGEYHEISVAPTVAYSQQGGSRRAEAGLYFTATPLTLGAVYRGVPLPGAPKPQQVLTVLAGVGVGSFRLGYSYDVSLSQFSRDLGGAHEISLALREFDSLEAAWRRLKRRNYPSIPCPAF